MAFTEIQNFTNVESGTVLIASGESLSDAFPSGGRRFVKVYAPTITSATLSFAVQIIPGGDFEALYDDEGNEVTVGSASTGDRTFIIPQLAGMLAFKVRSGTSGSPVNQGADRTFTISASGGKDS